jgi:ankyrin repeat protein
MDDHQANNNNNNNNNNNADDAATDGADNDFGDFTDMSFEEIKAFVQEDPQRVKKARDTFGWTLLAGATNGRQLESVEWLIKIAAADPNERSRRGNTALFLTYGDAGTDESCELAEMLLAAGADPTIQDNGGVTPLMFFTRKGNPDLVGYILKDPRVVHKMKKGVLRFIMQVMNTHAILIRRRLWPC